MTGNGPMNDDDDGRWTRPLWVGLAALVVVSLLIGGVISVVAYGAARITVLNASDDPTTSRPSLYLPPLSETEESTPAGPSTSSSPSESGTPEGGDKTDKPSRKPRPQFSLQANPLSVAPGEQINLTGVYAREGAILRVQRFQGAWTDFDATATVRGGLFETYIYTSVSGTNRLRMIDLDSGKTSNPVRVQVG